VAQQFEPEERAGSCPSVFFTGGKTPWRAFEHFMQVTPGPERVLGSSRHRLADGHAYGSGWPCQAKSEKPRSGVLCEDSQI